MLIFMTWSISCYIFSGIQESNEFHYQIRIYKYTENKTMASMLVPQNFSFRRKGILSAKGGSEYFPVRICEATNWFAVSV